MITKENLLNYCSYPLRALTSRRFYFDVLFGMKGPGMVYVLILSLILAIPSSLKIQQVMGVFKSIDLPALIAMIPPSYLSDAGVFTAQDPSVTYKEIFTADGNLAIVYNVEDKNISQKGKQPIIELNSTSMSIASPGQRMVITYTDIFAPGTNFDPFLLSTVADNLFNTHIFFILSCLLVWFFCIIAFNALIMAAIAKFLFFFIGKIKTSFVNIVRLSSYANTIVALMLLIEMFLNIPIPFNLIMFLPLVYLLIFMRSFRRELEINGVENFVKKFTPEGTRIKNYSSGENEDSPRRDISEFTDGLDSTTNRMKSGRSDNVPDEEPFTETENTDIPEKDSKNSSDQRPDKSKDNSNDGPGFFAP